MSLAKTFAVTASCAAFVVSPALARSHAIKARQAASSHHRQQGYAAYAYPHGFSWEGGAVAAAAARAQTEPGVTQELAPDARQTATGGPSGGVPGFSGGM